MPLMISRIGHSRGRPVAQGFGRCGAITRHSASVRSVWYRVTMRLCCCRVVGVHMANPRLVGETPWNHNGRTDSTLFQNLPLTSAEGTELGYRQLAAEPWPRTLCGCIPRQCDRREGSAALDGGGLE